MAANTSHFSNQIPHQSPYETEVSLPQKRHLSLIKEIFGTFLSFIKETFISFSSFIKEKVVSLPQKSYHFCNYGQKNRQIINS